jgi:hypothetical protein
MTLPDEPWEDDDNAGLYTLPPGEEGFAHSHAGEIFQQILEDLDPLYVVFFSDPRLCRMSDDISKRGDPRTRNDRIQERINSWRIQMPSLVDAYLAWKHDSRCSPGSENASSAETAMEIASWPIVTLSLEGT